MTLIQYAAGVVATAALLAYVVGPSTSNLPSPPSNVCQAECALLGIFRATTGFSGPGSF